MNRFFKRFIDLIVFYWKSKNYKQISHKNLSSFIFRILENKPLGTDQFAKIEKIRTDFLKTNEEIPFEEIGAGKHITSRRKVKEIANYSLSPEWKCKILYNLAKEFNNGSILELGTSLGISTAYLASGNINNIIHTIEGNRSVAELAQKCFSHIGFNNIVSHIGNFDLVLEVFLTKVLKIDLAYIDGNHNYNAVLRYFKNIKAKCHIKSVVIIDDIYWSEGMKKAWKSIKMDEGVTCSVDLFQLGIILFDPQFEGNHYVISSKLKAF
ncbi:MAG: O-methyltransferase [Deltaproteobacteria bacterium]